MGKTLQAREESGDISTQQKKTYIHGGLIDLKLERKMQVGELIISVYQKK